MEALEKLNRGIQESRQEVQLRAMKLAQEYFGDSVEELKQQIKENRSTLKDLPDQLPGGQEEAFQALFQELMDNYTTMEECINEAQENVTSLDVEKIARQGEIDATDAARRQARELGIDLTEVEGSGTNGRITVDDIKKIADSMEEAADEDDEPKASEAARRRAEELGLDLSQIEGTGAGGQITVKDVTSLSDDEMDQIRQATGQAQDAAGQAAGQAQQVAGQATDQAGQVTGQAQEAAGGAAQQAQDTAGQAAGQVQDTVGGLTGGGQQQGAQQQGGGGPLGGVTDQVGQVAGQVQDTAGQAAGQAQQVAGQATDQAGQVAGQAQEAAGGAAQQAQDTAGQATGGDSDEEPKATNAARRRAKELGVDLSTIQGTGSGGLITIKDVTGS
jgi:pyruvate/2-oxoglutarate dehydrogenase complex dihydrolipoamide acyltransferase (E2) component